MIPRTRRARLLAGIWGTAAVLVIGTWWFARSPEENPLAELAESNKVAPTTLVPVSIVALPGLPVEAIDVDTAPPAPTTTQVDDDVAPTSTTDPSASPTEVGAPTSSSAANTTTAPNAGLGAASTFGAYSVIDDGGVVVLGAVPDEDARSRVLAASKALTGLDARDELVIDATSPMPTDQIPLFVPSAAIFDADSAQLLPSARASLDVIAGILNRSAGQDLIIRGHSEDQGPGDDAYNMRLSDDRGRSVFNYLVAAGVSADRLRLEPRGELEPLFVSDDIRVRQLNRRVELRLIPTS